MKAQGHSAICSIRRDGEIGLVLALNPRRGSSGEVTLSRLAEGWREAIARGGDADRVVIAVGGGAGAFADASTGCARPLTSPKSPRRCRI